MQFGVSKKPTVVAWLDNSVSEHVGWCNWRVSSADEQQPDGEGTSELVSSSRKWKEQN